METIFKSLNFTNHNVCILHRNVRIPLTVKAKDYITYIVRVVCIYALDCRLGFVGSLVCCFVALL